MSTLEAAGVTVMVLAVLYLLTCYLMALLGARKAATKSALLAGRAGVALSVVLAVGCVVVDGGASAASFAVAAATLGVATFMVSHPDRVVPHTDDGGRGYR